MSNRNKSFLLQTHKPARHRTAAAMLVIGSQRGAVAEIRLLLVFENFALRIALRTGTQNTCPNNTWYNTNNKHSSRTAEDGTRVLEKGEYLLCRSDRMVVAGWHGFIGDGRLQWDTCYLPFLQLQK